MQETSSFIIGQPTKSYQLGHLLPRELPLWKQRYIMRPRVIRMVYVIRDGDRVLYVGMTCQGIRHRIKQHLYYSQLGQEIKKGLPISKSWQVDVYAASSRQDARQVERELIEALQPELNHSKRNQHTPA